MLSIQLFVGIFSIIDSQDEYDLFFLVYDVEKSKLSNSVTPSVSGVPLKLLDVVTPKRLCSYMGIDIRIKFFSQESGVV